MNRYWIMGIIAAAGCVAGIVRSVRRNGAQSDAQQSREDLRNWEAEGGKPAAAAESA